MSVPAHGVTARYPIGSAFKFFKDEEKMTHRLILLVALFTAHAAIGAEINGCVIRSGTLCVESDLRGADLRGADLSRAGFRLTNLSGADLRGANLFNANMDLVKLTGANLNGAMMDDVDLTNATMVDAKLNNAQLNGANLKVPT